MTNAIFLKDSVCVCSLMFYIRKERLLLLSPMNVFVYMELSPLLALQSRTKRFTFRPAYCEQP